MHPRDSLTPERPQASPSTRRSRRTGAPDEEQLRRRVYDFSDLSAYSFRDRLVIRATGVGLYSIVRALSATIRWDSLGRHHFESIVESGHRAIFASWHSTIFASTYYWRNLGIVVMSSVSRDAEYTGRLIKRFGYGTARGSSTRGGARALAEMAECLAAGLHVGFTIDGPRGPAYVAKPGAVTLARHTGQAILPFHVAARRVIEVPSWDRLQIPLPFTRARAFIGEPIYVARNAPAGEVAEKQAALQATLDRLRREADEWRMQ